MQVAFRTDASLEIGTGHVMRCLTLADALRERGAVCRFVCRELPGNLIADIRLRGYQTLVLPSPTFSYTPPVVAPAHAAWLCVPAALDAEETLAALGAGVDWLVLDHYAVDAAWERALSSAYRHLLVIDDLADRPHICDLLLDQTFGRNETDYSPWVPKDCTMMCGSRYALLRSDFFDLRGYSLQRRVEPRLKQILITLGGVDKNNATAKVLGALRNCALPSDCRILVVMGTTAPWLNDVQRLAESMPWNTKVKVGVNNMAQLMADSDLAIGAAGATSWERCCLGLPSAMLVIANNQSSAAKLLEKAGAVRTLPSDDQLPTKLAELILDVMRSDVLLRRLSDAASVITDGQGAVHVVRQLLMDSTDA
jgi:UDP-2,4-diacetamido-2,4,6-trideoxy-beta-L-altropyranose hydrolase